MVQGKVFLNLKLDLTFLAPRVNANILFISPYLRKDAKSELFFNIFVNSVKSEAEVQLADARDSGNDFSFEYDEK